MLQILGITGDNASNNDTMIQYLSDALDEFPGPANQTRCFVHTVNLIAKLILRPFDIRRMKDIHEFNDIAHALAESAEDESTEQTMGKEEDKEEGEDDDASLRPIRLLNVQSVTDMVSLNEGPMC